MPSSIADAPRPWKPPGLSCGMARFLVIAPHPDDAELGMGGTIIKLARQGHDVHILDMTNGEPTPHGTVETRARESACAAEKMGVGRSNLGLTNREVVHDLASRHKLAAALRRHRPDVMFVPFFPDAHPDHIAVHQIAVDARFDAKLSKSSIPGDPWWPRRLIYYYCTHLRAAFDPTFCIDVSDTFEQKIAACQCYVSQGMGPDSSGLDKHVRAMHGYFGGRIGTQYAEPFYSSEVVGLTGFDQMVLTTGRPEVDALAGE